MLPIIEGDHLVCPYCKPKRVVLVADDLEGTIRLVKTRFSVREAHYHLAEFCKGCGTVWLCERVNPESNDGKPFVWDTYASVAKSSAES